MAQMQSCIVAPRLKPKPKPLFSNGRTRSGRHFQISPPALRRSLSLLSVAMDASSKEPEPNKPDRAIISGANPDPDPPTILNSSAFSLQFPDIPSTWSTWLIGAAVFLSVPLYTRIKRVEEVIEKADETAETAIGAIDHAAKEVGKLASDLAKTSSNTQIKQVALKIEAIADRVERDAHKADEVLHKVEHITDEIEELLEPMVEGSEAKEREKTNGEKTHKHHYKSESHDNDL